MKTKDIRELTDDELKTRLAELKNELFNLRFRHATGQLENPVSLRNEGQDDHPRKRTEGEGLTGRTGMERNLRKERVGIVVSDKMEKTVVVAIEERAKHPLYKKTIKSTHRFKAHDEKNECGVGDKVRIVETRKLSKDKNWRVAEIIEKAK